MMNFSISFAHPWLLLLLIPALALIAYTFFKVNKRFRYSANRIVSVVLCVISIFLSVFLVSGMKFDYDVKNKDNEVILLVDYSDSNKESKAMKDDFVRDSIDHLKKDVKLGVVKFGYDQVYALELTKDMVGAYETYASSEDPSDVATNIDRALSYAGGLFKNKKTAKIVVLTDGIETEGSTMKAISTLALEGVSVDFVEFDNRSIGNEVQLSTIKMTDKAVEVDKSVPIEIALRSTVKTDLLLTAYDNGEQFYSQYISINRGDNVISLDHTFATKGVHELTFVSESVDDKDKRNNTLHSYVNIETVDKLLILDREGESDAIESIVSEEYQVVCKNIKDAPTSIDTLRAYDEVILMNIANRDMPEGFDMILSRYVNEFGGGLLTVGGTRIEQGEEVANVYNREDMKDTLYQEMIPVIAEDYKPPVAVTLVIDISGSMMSNIPHSNKTMMDEAKASAKAALKALDNRDYMGVVVFGDAATVILEPTPVSQRDKIYTAIDRIEVKLESTIYSHGLEKAGIGLKAHTGVNKKHIILISDGAPAPSDNKYLDITRQNYDAGITTSVISYGSKVLALEQIAEVGHGNNYVSDVTSDSLTEAIHKDLATKEIREYEYKTFRPTVGESSAILDGIKEEDIPTLDGFFGTKLKRGASGILLGEYGEPIYAEWNYGKGRVGSFMSDLHGKWSTAFLSSSTGKAIINNIVASLFPPKSIVKDDVEVGLIVNNFEIKTNIYSKIASGEYVNLTLTKLDNASGGREVVSEMRLDDFDGNATLLLDATKSGLYEIKAEKCNRDGEVISSTKKYEAISYSKEYDMFLNSESHAKEINFWADASKGKVIDSGDEVYQDLVMSYHKTFDPRYIFASLVIVLLLGDLAARKFKFKKLSEMRADSKNNKKNKEQK